MSGSGDYSKRRPATRLVRGGRRKEWTGPVVNPPVWRGSTHLYATDAERQAAGGNNADGQFFYGRRGAPTQWALAEALTEIEPGAHGTVLYPSGVAAIAGVMLAVLKSAWASSQSTRRFLPRSRACRRPTRRRARRWSACAPVRSTRRRSPKACRA